MRTVTAALAAGCAVAGLVAISPAPAYADGDSCDTVNSPDTLVDEAPGRSDPVTDLRIDDVHDQLEQRGLTPGAGVVVAVLDSGISEQIGVSIAGSSSPGRQLFDWHGTAVAGVIAGPRDEGRLVGFAPAVDLIDVRVYDKLDAEDGEVGLSPATVSAGLQYLVQNHARFRTDIAVVPMPVSRTPAMDAAIEQLEERDVIVVAASGDRPAQERDPLFSEYGDQTTDGPPAGEDAAADSWPAGYDNRNVVAVATGAPDGADAAGIVLQNSAIDVAAPTTGLVGYGMNGAPCVVPSAGSGAPAAPGSAFAAAEVAGVLALLETAYAGETAAQLLARLYATATGTASVTANNVLTGHGIIQPLEALLRPLRPTKDGELPRSEVLDPDNAPVAVPESDPDLLASTRENAVWWGLIGGGALVVALVLRPVLARRRR